MSDVVLLFMQVLTQEDWNTVMYDGMRATSKWAALYFILLMTVGNYILFNLLVAILVEGFATQPVGFAPPAPLLPPSRILGWLCTAHFLKHLYLFQT